MVSLDPTLNWELRGFMKSSEILALPPGARRLAETTLWMLQATPEQIEAHWDDLTSQEWPDHYELSQFISIWIEKDLDAAHAHTKGTRWSNTFYYAYAKIDPSGALKLAGQNHHLRSTVLHAIAESDPDLALEEISKYPGRYHYQVKRSIAAGLYQQDPEACLNYVEENFLHGSDREHLNNWLLADPYQALTWALSHQKTISSRHLKPILEKDPEFVAARILEMPTGFMKSQMLSIHAKTLATIDPTKAITLANTYPPKVQAEALLKIGEQISHDHPSETRQVIKQLLELENDTAPQRPLGLLYREWAQKDPHTVLELSKEISPSLEERMIGQWAGIDGPSALDWVKELPKGSRYDALAGKVIQTTLYHQNDYSTFLALANEMTADAQAQEHRKKIISRWISEDSQGLKAHLNSGKATQEEVQTAREIQSSK